METKTTTQAPARSPQMQFREEFSRIEDEIRKVLPPHVTLEKFARVVQTAVQKEPKLLAANRKSLFAACVVCATDGLIPDGREAALVTYELRDQGLVAAYMPMVGGILKKIRNSGELKSIFPEVVYQNDKFRYWVDDLGPHIQHEPLIEGDRGSVKCTYTIAVTRDGGTYVELINEKQMADIRKMSRGKNGPWGGSFADEMRKKSCIRRLSKRLPMSTDVEQVIQRDDDFYDLELARSHEKGLAAELNGGALEGQTTAPGDGLQSLSDLRNEAGGSLPREDVEGHTGGRGVEPGGDVPEASRRAAPDRVADDGAKVPAARSGAQGQGVASRGGSLPTGKGDPRAPGVEAST